MSVTFRQTWDQGRPDGYDNAPFVLNEIPLYGIERIGGVDNTLPNSGPLTQFLCLDDDGNVTHSGQLTNDDECDNQSAALRWAETDMGATRIVCLTSLGDWKQEIG